MDDAIASSKYEFHRPAGETPVVLVAFNRPDLTRRTLDAIRGARPEQLLLIVDGPRGDHPDDAERCAEVRALLDDIDWPCEVHRRYAEVNLGLEANVELGLDWAFGIVPEAIVFEDDCRPDPSFFGYAAELLERYRDDERVWQIAGNSHWVPSRLFGDDSYRFSAWASVWGWATWADRWQRHRREFGRDHRLPGGDLPQRVHADLGTMPTLVTRSARRHFAEAATSPDVITHGWDKHWWVTIIREQGLCVTPRVNLVENVGFGADATHTHSVGRTDQAASAIELPLRHPSAVVLDAEVERELELLLNRVGGRAAKVARQLVRSPRARATARRLVNSRGFVALSRAASRATEGDRPSRSGHAESPSGSSIPPVKDIGALASTAKRRIGWFVRDRFPDRKVVREVQGVRMTLPWSHRLPDYAAWGPQYGQNLVELARLLAESAPLRVLDIGANVGDSTLQILHAADGAVLCVEADPAYLDFLHLNVDGDPRVSVVEALLSTDEQGGGQVAVRTGGTTRFVSGSGVDAMPTITPAALRESFPAFTDMRLVKSDTDGYDVELVPAVAAAWADSRPVLFFEYDPYLIRLAGLDPFEVWSRLESLGYRDIAVWDHGGTALGRTTTGEVGRAAKALDDAPTTRPQARGYWDVAVVHADDAAGIAALDRLIPAEQRL